MKTRWLSWALPMGALFLSCKANAQPGPYNPVEHYPVEVVESTPYQVDIVDGGDSPFRTYFHGGRHYVLGEHGARYRIRIHNPTAYRVEAVVSVDGLDSIDGQTAGYNKRGYVIPPGGVVTVDGFRVSTEAVAAFRFSSVRGSYASRKGDDRNVGVIGVAFFSESSPPAVIYPEPAPHGYEHPHHPRRGPRPYDEHEADSAQSSAPRASAEDSLGSHSAGKSAAPRGRASDGAWGTGSYRRERRPGLGTKFGETRYSSVQWTQFMRASESPTVVIERRYNNAAGLRALGIIPVQPLPDPAELAIRERAEPFPSRFAQPPPR